ncbi:chemotaxis protein [Thiolapillus sp.]
MRYLIAVLAVPLLLVGWLLIQQLGRRFARENPELGPYREEGGGCGKSCGCKGSSCQRREK